MGNIAALVPTKETFRCLVFHTGRQQLSFLEAQRNIWFTIDRVLAGQPKSTHVTGKCAYVCAATTTTTTTTGQEACCVIELLSTLVIAFMSQSDSRGFLMLNWDEDLRAGLSSAFFSINRLGTYMYDKWWRWILCLIRRSKHPEWYCSLLGTLTNCAHHSLVVDFLLEV